jgi:hypothetical protein
MRTGSINYLENGKIYKFDEKYNYNYGNGTPKANSSLSHTMNVDFEGDKGISEFYGQGFFKNNRALSAWKKIRYELVRNPVVDPQGKVILSNRTANKIQVDAALEMDMTPGASYDMKYGARVWDGVIETRDSSGFTNKSTAKRIDWEHSTLSRGDYLDIHNNLSDFQLYYTLAPPDEWLPCCFDGTHPLSDNLEGTKVNALSPPMILPQKDGACTRDCKKRCIENCSPVDNADKKKKCLDGCENSCNLTCNAGACPGFECIFTYDSGTAAPVGGILPKLTSIGVRAIAENDTAASVRFSENSPEENARRVNYTITVKNDGDYKLDEVLVDITLPMGVMPDDTMKPGGYSVNKETAIQKKLGPLLAKEEKLINFHAFIRFDQPSISAKAIGIKATGKIPNSPDIIYVAKPGDINWPPLKEQSGTEAGGGT